MGDPSAESKRPGSALPPRNLRQSTKTIRVTKEVGEGACSKAENGESIGTQGCGTCVGLIVVDNSNIKTCAHFNCGLKIDGNSAEQASKLETISNAVQFILGAYFPSRSAAVRWGYCTGSPAGADTAQIISAIMRVYGYSPKVFSTSEGGIAVRHNGEISIVKQGTAMRSNDATIIINEDASILSDGSVRVD